MNKNGKKSYKTQKWDLLSLLLPFALLLKLSLCFEGCRSTKGRRSVSEPHTLCIVTEMESFEAKHFTHFFGVRGISPDKGYIG